jgi:hypothetical protein
MRAAGLVLLLSCVVGCAPIARGPSPTPSDPAVEQYPTYVEARPACDRGDAKSCAWIASMYRFGIQVPFSPGNRREAFIHAERACARGMAEGCHDLGVAYIEPWGVARDLDRARAVLDDACAKGFAPSCVLLAALSPYRVVPQERAAGAIALIDAECKAPRRRPAYVWNVQGAGGEFDVSSCDVAARMLPSGNADRGLPNDGERCAGGCRGSLEASSSCIDGVCLADLRLGARCGDAKQPCTRGTFCGSRRTCEARRRHGAPCEANHQCDSEYCSYGVCSEPPNYTN